MKKENTLSINSKTNLKDLEEKISICPELNLNNKLTLPTKITPKPFVHSRLGILVHMYTSHSRKRVIINTPAWEDRERAQEIIGTIYGCIALNRSSVTALNKEPIPLDWVRQKQRIALKCAGVLESLTGQQLNRSVTVLDFDPDFPIAQIFGGKKQFKSRKNFEAFIRSIRSNLEHGWKRYKKELEAIGNYKDIADFLFEAHDNSWEYGHTDSNGANIQGIRYVQIRRYIGRKSTILNLCTDFSELYDHVSMSISEKGTHQLIEVSVSDFGEGIVDYFLSTKTGRIHRKQPRHKLLKDLLLTNLTSKEFDSSAGKGIEILLRAALGMGAFVTLRTGEFWLYRSAYMRQKSKNDVEMFNVADKQYHAKIPGTHWGLIYHDPV